MIGEFFQETRKKNSGTMSQRKPSMPVKQGFQDAEDAEDAELYAINFCCAEDAQICAYKKTCCVGNPTVKAWSFACLPFGDMIA